MKKLVLLVMFLVVSMLLMAQASGGQVRRPDKKQQTTVVTPNKNNNKKKKDNAPKRDRMSNNVVTPQKEEQPKPKQELEAAGYDVTFTCNVPSATITIDGVSYGDANRTQFLKTGSHTVELAAEGYEDYSQSITVNSKQRSFSMNMTKVNRVALQISQKEILQKLIDNMVQIDGGTFTMGATSEHKKIADKDEKPTHKVTLSSFSIGKYEVTQEEWEAVMGSNPSESKGSKLPIENVSWNDCQEFIHKLNLLTGKKFRLPTEAEWEYAARGGKYSHDYMYAGSNDIGNVAWYSGNSGNKMHEVGQKQPNELGLYDMSGNVWEWCNDWYGNYDKSFQTNPIGSLTGPSRVSRGGSCFGIMKFCRVSLRNGIDPNIRLSTLGLRLAL